ncbi:MAG: ATP-binding cassette domain-containing protein [Acidobacteriota bacterium]|nr:ATP-binding cassette domain-containing protein [Acidobacteriota bacterium]
MIRFDHMTVTYSDRSSPVLRDVDLLVEEGELVLVVGPTGAGKSTFLGTVNGLVPHFSGGTLAGRVTVGGRDTRDHRPRDLADLVGVVSQDPLAGFVTDTVEEELAYGMEQLAIAPDVMRKRVEETLDLLGVAELRDRPLHQLSGGQQQRVAIGAVLTTHPRVLVLDEPTSALDPTAAEEVLATITRLVHDLGVTVLLAEHRLERVVQYADRIVEIHRDGRITDGPPEVVMATSAVAPPVVELGRLAGWEPLPLSVRDARRSARHLRQRIPAESREPVRDRTGGAPVLRARNVVVRYGPTVAVGGVDVELDAGRVTALMGRNGSGKSSLLWALQGSGPRHAGAVTVDAHGRPGGLDPARLPAGEARRLVGLIPQTPTDLLYLDTVAAECRQADLEAAGAGGDLAGGAPARQLLEELAPGIDPAAHPRDLSEGQRLALVLAIQLTAAPPVVLLDEPTRGLDYRSKEHLHAVLERLAAGGRSVVVATHDVEFAAKVADRVIVMAAGDVVADGPAVEILTASPAYAPQVAKILAPAPYLTVDQVATALRSTSP